MRTDKKGEAGHAKEAFELEGGRTPGHLVFDFTGLERPNVCDLSLILTARLQAAPTASVWLRSLPWQTARILQLLHLDHLFRHYPTGSDELN